MLSEAQRLTARHSNASAVALDVNDTQKVSELVAEADVVIRYIRNYPYLKVNDPIVCSLLPVPLHPRIAKLCIQHRTHMVTASYISPDMKALHNEYAFSSYPM